MSLHFTRIVTPVAFSALALFSVSCSSMNLPFWGNSAGNSGGIQGAQSAYAQQQPYYQGQQQSHYGGQGQQQAPGAGYGGGGAYQPSAAQGYPGTPAYAPPHAGGGAATSHVVARGDTLWSISQRYGRSVGAIQAANNLSGDVIRPGEVLQIP